MLATARSTSRSAVLAGLAAISVLLALGGCGVLTDDLDPSGLEPGTFRLRADGQTLIGEARFDTSAVFAAEANLLLLVDGRSVMQIRSADLLTTPQGGRFSPVSSYEGYLPTGGEVEITGTGGGEVAGRFWFEMRDYGYGWIRGSDIRVEGAFRAPLPAGRVGP
ncbi:MAG TPA: hypothetical protein VF576_00710 [Rubricoccaceae bacterium]|jgi:hypothetical protein